MMELETGKRETVSMLFSAHFDQDPLRIESAMRHLVFLTDLERLTRACEVSI